MSRYRVAINMEWTGKCNARCVMCPREAIVRPRLMSYATFDRVLSRLGPEDVFRVVVAGYGEPTTHPRFEKFVEKVAAHPVRFDMVSNGERLDEDRLRHLDGAIGTLTISFSSVVKAVYEAVHVNLDHRRVMQNIVLAQKLLRRTEVAISLTPLEECLDTLEQTIDWLHRHGITRLTMSPTLYNRAGRLCDHRLATRRLRQNIERHELHSQELDFVPSFKEIVLQNWHNRFRCLPRNVDLFITADGDYLYCYNDISHQHRLGSADRLSVREVLQLRESQPPIPELCNRCNMRDRYGLKEVAKVALGILNLNKRVTIN